MASKIQFKFNKDSIRSLKTHGADHSVYKASAKFDLHEMLMPFKPSIENVRNGTYNKQKQFDGYMKLLGNPIKGHPLIVLGSYPTDSRAKLLAANLLLSSINQYRKMAPRQRKGKAQPMWHRLYGGYKDILLDTAVKPSFLVISNITEESTGSRYEKLRDILEKHSDVPRVLVIGSKPAPVTLIAQRLFLGIKHAAFVGNQNVVRSILDD